MSIQGKKILVTGGSGFIGSNLIDKLQSQKAEVENYDTSRNLDICDNSSLRKFIKRKYDYIFHLAAISGPTITNSQTEKTFKINTMATLNICSLISEYSPKTKLILSGSRLEYGKPMRLPVSENHPTQPMNIYGLSKLAATHLAMIYKAKNNMDVTIFRTSNVYGPHQKGKFKGYNVVNHFLDSAIKDKKITIYGDGKQQRDYIFITDLIDAFILGLKKEASGKIYNLGYGKGISLKEMARLIIKIVGSGSLEFLPWPSDYKQVETGSYVTDISKIKKELKFKPKINFEVGIRKSL